jgi:hypothetical protein
MTWLLVLLIIVAVIYVLGWALAATFLMLHDHYNKLFYLGLALLWPVYVFDLIRVKAWK